MRIKGGVGAPGWEVNASEPLQSCRAAALGIAALTRVRARPPQALLTPQHAVLAETGDSWFNCLKLKLPDGCGCAARVGAAPAWEPLQPYHYNLDQHHHNRLALQPCNGGGLTLGGADCAGLAPRRYEFQCQYGSIGWRCAAVGVSQPRWDICR